MPQRLAWECASRRGSIFFGGLLPLIATGQSQFIDIELYTMGVWDAPRQNSLNVRR